MRLNLEKTNDLIPALEKLALDKGYEKIFAKIPAPAFPVFKSAGYRKEAVIPGLYSGTTDGCLAAKYFSTKRQTAATKDILLPLNKPTGENGAEHNRPAATNAHRISVCHRSDVNEMSALFRQVFKTYPFPIHRPEFLMRMMEDNAIYFCIRIEGLIAAIAAAEMDVEDRNAEMTDFATLPRWRKMGFAGLLLHHMETTVAGLGIKTVYSIARAASAGMNKVFFNMGYQHAGVLKNNSQICGSIESMAVWYKHLRV
jgi:putative beta-lysine N-acetyltransferase